MKTDLDDVFDTDDDRQLAAALAPLRGMEPPLETKVAVRVAVAKALGEACAGAGERRLPWWRRSVTVPAPLALAVIVMLAALIAIEFRPWRRERTHAPTSPEQQLSTSSQVANGAAPRATAKRRPAGQQYQRETYLCGIGQVHTEAYYLDSE